MNYFCVIVVKQEELVLYLVLEDGDYFKLTDSYSP